MGTRSLLMALLASISIAFASCASTGPPLPPSLELAKPPGDLHASRKGNRVTLSWTIPSQTTDRQSVRYFGPTRICRSLITPMKQCEPQVGEAPAPPANTRTQQESGKKVAAEYVDTLPAQLMQANPTALATYAIEVFNRDNHGAGISNQVRIPLAPTLPAPSDFQATTSAEGIVLTWQGAAEIHEAPEISHRYRIYRREANETKPTAQDVVAGDVPLDTAGPVRFVDPAFEWEKTYHYHVNVVTVVSTGFQACPATAPPGADCMGANEIEGDDTPTLKVFAHDIFPPSVPGGLQAAFSGPGQQPFIDLNWAPVTQNDLAGYNVYRHEEGQPASKINAELVKTPAYRDTNIASGKQYFYSVTAVDTPGNESAKSEEASEQVP